MDQPRPGPERPVPHEPAGGKPRYPIRIGNTYFMPMTVYDPPRPASESPNKPRPEPEAG